MKRRKSYEIVMIPQFGNGARLSAGDEVITRFDPDKVFPWEIGRSRRTGTSRYFHRLTEILAKERERNDTNIIKLEVV